MDSNLLIKQYLPRVDVSTIDKRTKDVYAEFAGSIATNKPDYSIITRFIDDVCISRRLTNNIIPISAEFLNAENISFGFHLDLNQVNYKSKNQTYYKSVINIGDTENNKCETIINTMELFHVVCEYILPLMSNVKNMEASINDFNNIEFLPPLFCSFIESMLLEFNDYVFFRFKQLGKFSGLKNLELIGGLCSSIDETIMKMEKLETLVLPSCKNIHPEIRQLKNLREITISLTFIDEIDAQKALYMLELEKKVLVIPPDGAAKIISYMKQN